MLEYRLYTDAKSVSRLHTRGDRGPTRRGRPRLWEFRHEARRKPLAGKHIVLWGPRGSGKTTLLHALLQKSGNAHCALSVTTSSLDDITRALERAYTDAQTNGLFPARPAASLVSLIAEDKKTVQGNGAD